MQNQNSVIKNYILSSEPFILNDKTDICPSEFSTPEFTPEFTPDSYLYHKPSKQNKGEISLFLLKI